jgi:hypothetical protein
MSRTVITLKVSDSIWPEVESWAERNKFKEIPSIDGGRSFRRGSLSGVDENLRIDQSEDEVVTESWLHTGLFFGVLFLFILPEETGIESSLLPAYHAPKSRFREKLNPLLEQLGAPTL